MNNRIDLFKSALEKALSPSFLEFRDDSHLHIGHQGSQGGAGHYSLEIISEKFQGMNRLQRHRLVYDALKAWFPKEIHALIINAKTLDEK